MSTMLPKYPASQRASPASVSGRREVLSPRATRILLDLVLLILIVVILYELRPTTPAVEPPPPSPPPLTFALIKDRYDLVHLGMTGEDVEALFGPPTEHEVSNRELKEVEDELWNFGRNPMPEPSEMFWDRWSDPANKGRWVAVLYRGYSKSARVYATIKEGF